MAGHTSGKDRLFCFGSTADGSLCAGFVGGGVDGRDDCGADSHAGAKASLTLESYYIQMSRESALCSPCVLGGSGSMQSN